MSYKIAIIDSGISAAFKQYLNTSIYIDEEYTVREEDNYQNSFNHGTNCFLIANKYVKEKSIVSIRILNNDGTGALKKLPIALEWCYTNNVKIINLSFGSTHFHDMTFIRTVINHYSNKGLIFVCASANNGYTTYPAFFSNVIGVRSDTVNDITINMNIHTGVEIAAPSEHNICFNGYNFKTTASNSYAVPVVTSKIHNILNTNSSYKICDIKKILLKEYYKNIAAPDWIETAYIIGKRKPTNAKTYFNIVVGNYNSIKNSIDTIILFKHDEKYLSERKNIISFDDKSFNKVYTNFFWCPKLKERQIESYKDNKLGIEIPLIIISLDKNIDEFYFLQQLKSMFYKEYFNSLAASLNPESVLYDLDYIPEKLLLTSDDAENLFLFLSNETYYKKADVIIISSNEFIDSLNVFSEFIKPQLKIEIYKNDSFNVSLVDDEGNSIIKSYELIDQLSIKDIFIHIKKLLSGEA